MARHLLIEEEQNRMQIMMLNVQRRVLRVASNPSEMREVVFRQLFRVSKEIAQMLCRRLMPTLRMQRTSGLPVHLQVR